MLLYEPKLIPRKLFGSALDIDFPLAFLWSSKVGSTFLWSWFLLHTTKISSADLGHVHKLRFELYSTKKYADHFTKRIIKQKRWYKLVRCPFERLVSAFVYVIQHDVTEFTKICEFSNIDPNDGLDFESFVSFLERQGFTHHHYKPQFSFNDAMVNATIVDLNHLSDLLSEFDQHLGQRKNLNLIYRNASPRHEMSGFVGNHRFLSVASEFPSYSCFFNKDLRARVIQLYSIDFEKYRYCGYLD